MKVQNLADNASAVTVVAQTGIAETTTPFAAGRDVVAVITPSGDATGAPVIKIQSSPDNSVWTDRVTSTGLATKYANIKLDAYMRATVTTGAGAGTYTASLLNGT